MNTFSYELDALRRYLLDQLVDSAEIARRADVGTSAVSNWIARYENFPDQVKKFGNARVYYWPEVADWINEHIQHHTEEYRKKTNNLADYHRRP